MSLGYSVGAKIGALIKEGIRKRNYQNFLEILQQNNYFNGIKEEDIEAFPLCIYRNPFSITKTYCFLCPNIIFFDLKPTTFNHNLSRVGILSKNTVKHFESRDANWKERFSILEAMEMVEVVFTNQDGKELKLRIFAEEPGEKSLTQDIGNTVRIGLRLKEITGLK